MSASRLLGALAAVVMLAACSAEPSATPGPPCPTEAPTSTSAQASLQGAEIATVSVTGAAEGEFVIELYGDAAPISTANFVELARCGFYDGIKFHRVLAGFVIQAGDPGTRAHDGDFEGIGAGGPGYDVPIEPVDPDLGYVPYSVSMANNGRSAGSHFFVAVADLTDGLPPAYTVFGQVVAGAEVVDAIAALPVNDPRIGIPVDPVTITSIVVSEAPEG